MVSLHLACITLLKAVNLHIAFVAAAPHLIARDGPSPSLSYDPSTTKYCTWWIDLTAEHSCSGLAQENFITEEELVRWVSSIDPAIAVCILIKAESVDWKRLQRP